MRLFAALALTLFVARPTFADEMTPAARALLTRGLRAYEVQKYAEAIDAFRAGYQLDPRPDFLYALGQAERLAGDYRLAIEAYKAFLRAGPPSLQAASAQKNIARCEAQLAAAPPPPEPSPAPLLAAPPPAVVAAPPRRRWYRDPAGDTLAALGLAGLAGGAALLGVGQHDIDAANAADRYDRFAALHDAAGQAGTERIAGIVTLALGGALAVAAIVRYSTLKGR